MSKTRYGDFKYGNASFFSLPAIGDYGMILHSGLVGRIENFDVMEEFYGKAEIRIAVS